MDEVQALLAWLDSEQYDFANALLAELGSNHLLAQRYCQMLRLQQLQRDLVPGRPS